VSQRIVRGCAALGIVLALAGCTATGSPSSPSASTAVGSAEPVRSSAPPTVSPTPSAAASSPAPTAVGFDRSKHSLDDPSSIWVVVDKQRPLQPKSWVPPDLVTPAVPHTNVPQLRKVAADALVRMFAGAKEDGITLVSLSAYRSYATQSSIFDRNLATLGRAKTLQLTAKPGYSEHQTGLADDLGDGSSCDLQVCFESHPAAKWLLANSWRYGWILRYPLGDTAVTGIQTEPWHFRYIGKAAAEEMHATGVKTLEQFFGLPDSPDY
jgi:D-alanyl-D-alanine carboxypeptidase